MILALFTKALSKIFEIKLTWLVLRVGNKIALEKTEKKKKSRYRGGVGSSTGSLYTFTASSKVDASKYRAAPVTTLQQPLTRDDVLVGA